MTTQVMQDKKRVKELYYKILENVASISEYYEYEQILSKYYPKDQIWRDLGAQGFRSWEDFYSARNPKFKPVPQKSNNDMPILVGAVLGLAVSFLIAKLFDK